MLRRTSQTSTCQLCLNSTGPLKSALIKLSRSGGMLDSVNLKKQQVACKCCESCYNELSRIRKRQLMWVLSPLMLLLASVLLTMLAVLGGAPNKPAVLIFVVGILGFVPMLIIGLFASTRVARKINTVVHPRIDMALKSLLSTKRWGVEIMTILYNKSTWWTITDTMKPGTEYVNLGEVVRTVEARER